MLCKIELQSVRLLKYTIYRGDLRKKKIKDQDRNPNLGCNGNLIQILPKWSCRT